MSGGAEDEEPASCPCVVRSLLAPARGSKSGEGRTRRYKKSTKRTRDGREGKGGDHSSTPREKRPTRHQQASGKGAEREQKDWKTWPCPAMSRHGSRSGKWPRERPQKDNLIDIGKEPSGTFLVRSPRGEEREEGREANDGWPTRTGNKERRAS